METRTKRGAGFTLIELLVVVAILAILVSLLLPALARARDQGRMALCLARIREIGMHANQYALDNGDLLPRSLHSAGIGFANGLPWTLAFYEHNFGEAWRPEARGAAWMLLFNERYRCPFDEDRMDETTASTGRIIRVSYGINVYYELERGEWDPEKATDRGRSFGRTISIPRPTDTVLFADVTTPEQEPDHLMAHFWTRFNAPPDVSEDRHDPDASYVYLDGHVVNLPFERTFDRAADLNQWNPITAR